MKRSDHSLVFVLDSSYYLDLFKIAIYSIAKNNNISTIDINIFVLPEQEIFFTKILEKFNFKNKFIHIINTKKYEQVTFAKQRDWTFSPAYRFEIFKLKHYKSILYMDADILCISGFLDVFQSDKLSVCKLHKITNNYYFENKFDGFNAGIMLIPKEFLKVKAINTLTKMCKKKTFNGNQEAFNFYFKDSVNFLPQSYNMTTDLLTIEALETTKIIHFIGLEKYNFTENKLYFSSYVNNFLSDLLKIKLNSLYNKYYLEANKFYND